MTATINIEFPEPKTRDVMVSAENLFNLLEIPHDTTLPPMIAIRQRLAEIRGASGEMKAIEASFQRGNEAAHKHWLDWADKLWSVIDRAPPDGAQRPNVVSAEIQQAALWVAVEDMRKQIFSLIDKQLDQQIETLASGE